MAVAKEPSLEISPIWTTLINEEVSKLQWYPEFPASTTSREILPDSSTFTPRGAAMERAFIGVLCVFLGRWGLRQFVLMDFILDHLCFLLSVYGTHQLGSPPSYPFLYHLRTETEPVSEKLWFYLKTGTMDNVQINKIQKWISRFDTSYYSNNFLLLSEYISAAGWVTPKNYSILHYRVKIGKTNCFSVTVLPYQT
jgi:hypothetical protein